MYSVSIMRDRYETIIRFLLIIAREYMEAYFAPKGDKFRGKSITTLPTVINKDLCRILEGSLKLKAINDLNHLRSIAEDRT